MADISKPEDVPTQQEGSTRAQGTAQSDDTQQELRGIGRAEIQPRPNTGHQTTNGQKDPYEYLRTPVAIGALVVSIFALCISFGSCYFSKRSADTAESVFRITQSNERPWVSVELRLPQPVVFDKEGNLGLAIDVDVKDVGRAVALDVISRVDMVFLEPNGSDVVAQERQMEQCDADRHPPFPSQYIPGRVLFPGVEVTSLFAYVGKWAKDIAPEIARAFPINKGKVGFAIVGCVSYRAASEDVFLYRHQTRFLYHLVQWEDDRKFISFIKPQGSPKNVTLVRMDYGNSAD